MSKTIIGIIGVKRSGKSTAYEFLREQTSSIAEFSLAAKLKTTCAEVFDIPEDFYHNQSLKEKELEVPVVLNKINVTKVLESFEMVNINIDEHVRPHVTKLLFTPRLILQYIGTEVLRNIIPDVHCIATGKMIAESDKEIIVIPDIRFKNEYDFFKDIYGENFKAYFISNRKAEIIARKDEHISEKFAMTPPHDCKVLDNNGSLSDFQKLIKTEFGGK